MDFCLSGAGKDLGENICNQPRSYCFPIKEPYGQKFHHKLSSWGEIHTCSCVCLLFKYYLSLCFNSLLAFPSGPQLKLVFSIYLFPKSNWSRNNSRELVCICVTNELIFIWGGGGSDSMPFQKKRMQISSTFIPIMSNSSGTKKDGSFSFCFFFQHLFLVHFCSRQKIHKTDDKLYLNSPPTQKVHSLIHQKLVTDI